MSQALLAPGPTQPIGQYEHTFETAHGDITVGVAFPGSESWARCEQAALVRWTKIFAHHGLTPDLHREMYAPYADRSIMLYGRMAVKGATYIDGLSQLQLPYPQATTIQESGFKTIEDALDGDKNWGTLNITNWEAFDDFPPQGLFDVLIHYSDNPYVTPFLESMQADLSVALASINQRFSDKPLRPGIATNIVTLLLRRMLQSHNHTRKDGTIIRGIHTLGPPSSYGAGDDTHNYVTAVLIDTEASTKADHANPGTNRLVPNVLELVCPRDKLQVEIDKMHRRGAFAT